MMEAKCVSCTAVTPATVTGNGSGTLAVNLNGQRGRWTLDEDVFCLN